MTMSDSPFAGMRDAKTFESGEYLGDGRYKLKIEKVIWKPNLNKGGSALIVETTVQESNNDKHPVGAKRTWFQKKNESFLGEVKLFCYAATGYDTRNAAHADVIKTQIEPNSEAIMHKAITDGILNGREVFVDVSTKPKKNSQGTFSKHVFSPAQPPLK